MLLELYSKTFNKHFNNASSLVAQSARKATVLNVNYYIMFDSNVPVIFHFSQRIIS